MVLPIDYLYGKDWDGEGIYFGVRSGGIIAIAKTPTF